MKNFPEFMKNPVNKIKQSSQYTKDIEGYVFDGMDGSQCAFWTCNENQKSGEHSHDYEEYLVCVHGQYKVIMGGNIITLYPGDELYIPKGVLHAGECIAGTRTIHVFGEKEHKEKMYKWESIHKILVFIIYIHIINSMKTTSTPMS